MSLYFGNITSTLSTLLVAATLAYILFTIVRHKNVVHWGRKIAVLAVLGLVVCCFVATRDGYHLSVQASFDDAVTAGLFTINSIQSTLCCIGGAVIALSCISSIFIKNQRYRKSMFLVLSLTILFKTFIIEISRGLV
jgi:hypothetical protein